VVNGGRDESMLARNKTRANIGVGLGMVLQLAGFLVSDPGEAGELVECFGCLLVLVSLPVLIWGCMHYAEGKGHSGDRECLRCGSEYSQPRVEVEKRINLS
jgi:hypothetical protein